MSNPDLIPWLPVATSFLLPIILMFGPTLRNWRRDRNLERRADREFEEKYGIAQMEAVTKAWRELQDRNEKRIVELEQELLVTRGRVKELYEFCEVLKYQLTEAGIVPRRQYP